MCGFSSHQSTAEMSSAQQELDLQHVQTDTTDLERDIEDSATEQAKASGTGLSQDETLVRTETIESDGSFLEFEPELMTSASKYELRDVTDASEGPVPQPPEPSAAAENEKEDAPARVPEVAAAATEGGRSASLPSPSSVEEILKRSLSKKTPRSVSFREEPVELPKNQIDQLVKSLALRRSSIEKTKAATSSVDRAVVVEKLTRKTSDMATQCDTISGPLVKKASRELVKLLSDPDLADDVAVECAEKALQRYVSPVMEEHELRFIMETEKALEEELLGLDKELVRKIPKEVDERLSKRAKAVAAAETVASSAVDTVVISRESAMQTPTLSRNTTVSTDRERGLSGGYTSPRPSTASSSLDALARAQSAPMTKLQATLSRRFASSRHLDLANLTAVYDRNYSWLKRHDSKVEEAQRRKNEETLKECSFQPRVFSTRPTEQTAKEEVEETALTKTDKACMRLYKKAREMHSKRYEKAEQFIYDEQKALSASAPQARPMPVEIYGDLFHPAASYQRSTASKLRPLPSGAARSAVRRNVDQFGKNAPKLFLELGRLQVAFDLSEEDSCDAASHQNAELVHGSTAKPCSPVPQDLTERGVGAEEETEAWTNATNEELINVFFERLSIEDRATAPPQESRRYAREEYRDPEARKAVVEGHDAEIGELTNRSTWNGGRRYRIAHYTGSSRLMTDVDFSEFLRRQEEYLHLRNRKIQNLRERKEPGFQLAPGTRRILKDKKAQLRAAKSDAGSLLCFHSATSSDLLAEATEYRPPSTARFGPRRLFSSSAVSSTSRRAKPSIDGECSFSPRITKRAQRLGPRSIDDLARPSERNKLRKEAQRLEDELKLRSHLTFRPQLNRNAQVRSRLNLRDPRSYMESIRRQQLEKQLKERRAIEDREALELEQCTFHPQTRPMPTSIRKELERKRSQIPDKDVIPACPEWGYALKHQTNGFA